MANRTVSFGPNQLNGTTLSPILELQSLPPGLDNTDVLVYTASTPRSSNTFHRNVQFGQDHPEGHGHHRQPSDIWSKFRGSDDDDGSEGRLSRTSSFKNLMEGMTLSRRSSGLSTLSTESVAGSTTSSLRRRMSVLKKLSSRQTEIYADTLPPAVKHRTFSELLAQTGDSTTSQLRDTLEKVEHQLRKSRRDKKHEEKTGKVSSRSRSTSISKEKSPVRAPPPSPQPPPRADSVTAAGDSASSDITATPKERRNTLDRIRERIRGRRKSGDHDSPVMSGSLSMAPVDEGLEPI